MKHFLVSKVAQKRQKFVWHSSPFQKNHSRHVKRTQSVIYKISLIINYRNTSSPIVPEYLVRNVVDNFHAFLSGLLQPGKEIKEIFLKEKKEKKKKGKKEEEDKEERKKKKKKKKGRKKKEEKNPPGLHHSFPAFLRLQVPDVFIKISIYGFNKTHELN